MFGRHIHTKNRSYSLASLALGAGILSIVLGIGWGPAPVYISSGLGLILAGMGFILAVRSPGLEKPVIFPLLVAGLNLLFLVSAVVLQHLFLSPLPQESQQMPLLKHRYEDHEHMFSLLGPAGWTYESLPNPLESGVRIRPSDQSQYMGISEVTVLVRRLDTRPPSLPEFLKSIATSLADQKRKHSRLFQFEVTPAVLLDKKTGAWSIFDVKRFWVPIRQVSLFGMKKNQYLCSVSTIGLKEHSTLSQVLCLGLFESITIIPTNKK